MTTQSNKTQPNPRVIDLKRKNHVLRTIYYTIATSDIGTRKAKEKLRQENEQWKIQGCRDNLVEYTEKQVLADIRDLLSGLVIKSFGRKLRLSHGTDPQVISPVEMHFCIPKDGSEWSDDAFDISMYHLSTGFEFSFTVHPKKFVRKKDKNKFLYHEMRHDLLRCIRQLLDSNLKLIRKMEIDSDHPGSERFKDLIVEESGKSSSETEPLDIPNDDIPF